MSQPKPAAEKPKHTAPKRTPTGPAPAHNDGPWWLLEPLRAGTTVAFGWRLTSLARMRKGAMVAVLRKGNLRADVHICRRNGAARGIGSSKHFDLILMNGAKGDAPTEEQLGRIVKSLGWVIQSVEQAHPVRVAGLFGAMTHAERVERFGPEGLA